MGAHGSARRRHLSPARPPGPGWNTVAIDQDPTPARRRSPLLTLVGRVALSAVMLGVLVWRLPDVHWSDLGPEWRSTSPIWLVGAGITMASAFALSTLRWQRVLAAMVPPPRFRRMFSHFLAGQFVSNVLPTAFGGDVVRVSRLGKDIDDNPTAFASVTIERLTGWLVLPLISGVAFAFQPHLTSLGSATATAAAIDGATILALVGLLLAASNRRFGASVGNATGWRRFLVAIHVGVDALRRRPVDTLEVVLAGTAFQILQCAAVWMAAEAIGLHQVSLGVALAFFPAAAIAQNLPIGLGGLGVREGIFVLFFGALGAPKALSITLGLVVYLLTIVTSSLGAPSFVLGTHRRGRSASSPSRNPHTPDVTPPVGES